MIGQMYVTEKKIHSNLRREASVDARDAGKGSEHRLLLVAFEVFDFAVGLNANERSDRGRRDENGTNPDTTDDQDGLCARQFPAQRTDDGEVSARRKKQKGKVCSADPYSSLPVDADRHVGENVRSDGNMRHSLHQRTHESSERPHRLGDHVIAVEGNVEQRVEYVGVGQIDQEVVRRRAHTTVGEDDPDDDAVAAHSEQNDDGEQKQEDALELAMCARRTLPITLTCTNTGSSVL